MKLLGVTDLAKRWNYTKQGVHQKLKQDVSFPKPIATINSGILVVAACFRNESGSLSSVKTGSN
jgi:hypothetical protein